jgi:hypothetical protein
MFFSSFISVLQLFHYSPVLLLFSCFTAVPQLY